MFIFHIPGKNSKKDGNQNLSADFASFLSFTLRQFWHFHCRFFFFDVLCVFFVSEGINKLLHF